MPKILVAGPYLLSLIINIIFAFFIKKKRFSIPAQSQKPQKKIFQALKIDDHLVIKS